MTRILVKGDLTKIVNHLDCKKVESVDLIVTEEGENEPIIEKNNVWIYSMPPKELNVKLDGLNDICKKHTVRIRLIGTEGELYILINCQD